MDKGYRYACKHVNDNTIIHEFEFDPKKIRFGFSVNQLPAPLESTNGNMTQDEEIICKINGPASSLTANRSVIGLCITDGKLLYGPTKIYPEMFFMKDGTLICESLFSSTPVKRKLNSEKIEKYKSTAEFGFGTACLLIKNYSINHMYSVVDLMTDKKALFSNSSKTCVGQLGNGNIVFVVITANGPTPTSGFNIQSCAQYMSKLNCKTAFMINYGDECNMEFNGTPIDDRRVPVGSALYAYKLKESAIPDVETSPLLDEFGNPNENWEGDDSDVYDDEGDILEELSKEPFNDKKLKIYIDAGHNKEQFGLGKISRIFNMAGSYVEESDIVYDISKSLGELLENSNYFEIKYARPDRRTLTGTSEANYTTARINDAIRWGCDLYISLHTRCGDDDTVIGSSCIIGNNIDESGADTREYTFGKNYIERIKTKFNVGSYKIECEPRYAVCEMANPSIIVNLGNIDVVEDVKKLVYHEDAYVQALYEAVFITFADIIATNIDDKFVYNYSKSKYFDDIPLNHRTIPYIDKAVELGILSSNDRRIFGFTDVHANSIMLIVKAILIGI